MISTATALIRPNTQPDSGPNSPQPKKVRIAIRITPITKYPATASAMRCMGALERWALATI
ncbi:hypothetical protein D3C78_1899150 [compost metagenome]